jgi:hypothetical protein
MGESVVNYQAIQITDVYTSVSGNMVVAFQG